MLDGAARIDDLLDRAVDLGQTAIATTDHGFVFGAYEFWSKAKARDIKPIIGLEAYVTPGTARQDRTRVLWGGPEDKADDVSQGGSYTHLTLLARSTAGMHNLFRLASLASIEGMLYKPRADRELFSRYGEGLIALSGCPSGEIQTRLRLGQYSEALRAAGELQDIFGRDNFFVEVMDHGIELERRVAGDLIRLASDLGAPLVATNDLHYTKAEDAGSHEALLCVQSGTTLDNPDRFRLSGQGYYLKSGEEMRQMFRELPGACDNTLAIAERCEVKFAEAPGKYMPRAQVPAGESETSWFIKEVERGLHWRYGGQVPRAVALRAATETKVITDKGYEGYYLVVADFVNWAKTQGIRVGPGRGSGAGSMAAYAMGITELDPLANGLIFERFLNPDRPSMPDFDIDFDERRRGEVIKYVSDKYGSDRVAQIVTYGTIKAKQAMKDAARVLGFPYGAGEKMTKAFPPPVLGKDISLSAVYDESNDRYKEAEEFRQLVGADPDLEKILETAKGLESLKRQWGVHAAGVIMSSVPLLDVIPLLRREQDGTIITQFDYPACEKLGLVKMDFLGLRNLTILDDALAAIRHNGKQPPVLEELPLDDGETYVLLSSGETLGVFQLDGGGMRSLLRQLKPDNFEDISAVQALYRPGPMGTDTHTNYALRKNGLQPIKPVHPELAEPLKDVLASTYGLIVYQEHVISIAQKLADFSLGQADSLRRAMGKKDKAELDRQFRPFSKGMTKHGYSQDAIDTIWSILLPFSDYAFNKAHAAAYGLISYWTAYLKAHFPAEYMAALLTSTRGDKDKSAVYLAECRRMGITVLPPDVNSSQAAFTPVGADIRFGLEAVRNVGAGVVESIVEARGAKGQFTSFQDFLDKVAVTVCNKRVIESLIKAGAFDSFGHPRRALLTVYEEAIDQVINLKRNEAAGQFDLFGGLDDRAAFSCEVPDLPEWDKSVALGFERDMLGMYVSDHPLRGLAGGLEAAASHVTPELSDPETTPDGREVTVTGLLTQLARKTTKKGDMWATATLEDLHGSVQVMFFPKTYKQVARDLAEDLVVGVSGRVNRRDEELSLYASRLEVLKLHPEGQTARPVEITLPANRVNEAIVAQLRLVLASHPGDSEVWLRLTRPHGTTVLRLNHGIRVKYSTELFGDLKGLLGERCLG
ncbi:MAG: DNA polymerase III subunit alpha [Micrococcales bacterium]|nr:DNA polymerase III subunit alpha [Micrococcales bacterium]